MPNGQPDNAFSGDGERTIDVAGETRGGIAVQENGRVVVAGGTSDPSDMLVARLRPNGSFDDSFSKDGMRRVNFGGGTDFAADVLIQSDGKIVVVGTSTISKNSLFAVARLNSEWKLRHQ